MGLTSLWLTVPKHSCGEHLTFVKGIWGIDESTSYMHKFPVYSCSRCEVYVCDRREYKSLEDLDEFMEDNKDRLAGEIYMDNNRKIREANPGLTF